MKMVREVPLLEIFKWAAAIMFLIATGLMFKRKYAARSTIPWILFFVGNLVWLVDSIVMHNIPWIALSTAFLLLDGGLIIARAWMNCIEE